LPGQFQLLQCQQGCSALGYHQAERWPLPRPRGTCGGSRGHSRCRSHKPQKNPGGVWQQEGFYHHARAQVSHPAMLLQRGPLHTPPASRLRPQARLQLFISRRLGGSSNCTVIPACDLLSGKRNTSPEEALAAFASWGAVHGSTANYTRMALSLVDSYFRRGPAAPPAQPMPPSQAVKRPRCDSSTSYDSGYEADLPIPALSSFRTLRFKPPADRQPFLPGFTRGGSRGGGNNPKRGFHGGSGPAGRSGR
jgi:hypothetical protein